MSFVFVFLFGKVFLIFRSRGYIVLGYVLFLGREIFVVLRRLSRIYISVGVLGFV